MEPAKRSTQKHLYNAKHTAWQYPTTLHPEAVAELKMTLSLEHADTHNAYQPGAFTTQWHFPTDTAMVPQTTEPPMTPSVTGLARAAQTMARREGALLDWTPNILVEQRAHHNANKAQRAGRQIHQSIWDKDGNLQPHSPWIVHFIPEDHGNNRKSTEVPITHALTHGHLQYTIPTCNAVVTYGAAHNSTYRLQPITKGTAYTLYTWAQYGAMPGPTWHPTPTPPGEEHPPATHNKTPER